MEDYGRALDLDPHDSSSHYNRGLIYQQNGDDRDAVTEFDAAICEDANNADARNRLAGNTNGASESRRGPRCAALARTFRCMKIAPAGTSIEAFVPGGPLAVTPLSSRWNWPRAAR